MKTELRFFDVFPSVVKAGKRTGITIMPNHPKHKFRKEEYKIRVVPKEKRDIPRNAEYRVDKNTFSEFNVRVKEGKVVFEYDFMDEQEYRIIILSSEDGSFCYDFAIYALYDDLYATLPFKGDLHIHTRGSDGLCTLSEVTSSYREKGYDFICITDHHNYNPSVEAKKMFEKVDSGLTIFPGEEVHNCSMGYFHIVNFGGKYSVNEIIESDYEALKKEIKKLSKTLDVPDDIDAYEFAFRKWICDEIRKSGGKAIFPHPYWTIYSEYHTETHMSFYSLKSGIYDIFEVLGGCESNENQMQAALYQELRAQGVDMPIVASSDAHDHIKHDSYFGTLSTIVFAGNEQEISDAIMDKKSVAVETYPGEHPRVYGNFRLTKYAHFLIENFFPVYRAYTKDIGALMRAYINYGDCTKSLETVNKKAQEYKNKYFGR